MWKRCRRPPEGEPALRNDFGGRLLFLETTMIWTGMTYDQAFALMRSMKMAKGGTSRKFEIRRQADGAYQLVEVA